MVVEHGEKVFALTLKDTNKVCDEEVWQTEHPKIVIINKQKHRVITAKMNLLPQNTDLTTYINSKLLYIEQAYKRAVDQLYTDAIHRRCLMHREILKNRLLLAPLSTDVLSTIVKNQLGFVGRVLGEVMYIIQCTPRVAQIRRTDACYNELPITVNNQSLFMGPITHIIQVHGVQVECNDITPPLYLIDGQWIGLSPYPVMKNAPEELQPDKEKPLKFTQIQPMSPVVRTVEKK